MVKRLFHFSVLLVALFSLLMPAEIVQAAPTALHQADLTSPQGFLNADGTLRLSSGLNGTLDLNGWNVQIDSQRGPLFSPKVSGNNAPLSVPAGKWAGIGDGGGNIDARVLGIAVSGTNVYVVGDFTDAANIPAADYVAKWDGSNWSALGSNGAGNGAIDFYTEAVAVSNTGDVYVGGDFYYVNNNGTYLPDAAHIAKWDGSNWSALGSNGAGGSSLNGSVYAIAVSSTNIYVGGQFTNVNNGGAVLGAADYVAKWDGSNWSALGSNGAGDGSFGAGTYISALAVNGTNVYVGGTFMNVNNKGTVLGAADNVAKWDGSNWSALGSNGAGDGSLNGSVYSLAVSGTNLYVGGQFTNVNNSGTVLGAADYVAKWDGSNWSALRSNGAGDGSLNNSVYSLAVSGKDVYVGGTFTNVNNGGAILGAADYVAKWDGSNWSALGSNGVGDGSIPNKSGPYIPALAIQGSNLLMGGTFYDVNNGGTPLPQADYIAKWDGSHWSSLGKDVNGALVNGYTGSAVNAIAVIGTDVYVGGYFYNVSNHGVNMPEADYIAKWDGSNWSALSSNGAGNGALNSQVYALAVIGTDLYVGGTFSNVSNNGTPLPAADGIAKWNGSNWSALSSNGAGNGALNNGVETLAVSGTNLYVGGFFTNVNNNGTPLPAADYVAKWDGSNWSALGSNGSGNGALNNGIRALAVSGTDVYVGGHFTNVNNGGTVLNAADYIAKWDGSNWSALGSNGAGNGSLNNPVYSLAVNGTDVYAGGPFTNVNNGGSVLTAADYIAKWNGSNWSALGSNGAGNGSLNGLVKVLVKNGTDLLVGGQFANVNNSSTVIKQADYLAAYGANFVNITYRVYLPLAIR